MNKESGNVFPWGDGKIDSWAFKLLKTIWWSKANCCKLLKGRAFDWEKKAISPVVFAPHSQTYAY
jgi:hypothetical protein